MKWYEVKEVTPDAYTNILKFQIKENAEKYIDDNPDLNLEGPDEVDTDTIYFEDAE